MRGWLIVSNDAERKPLSKMLTIDETAAYLCISVDGLRSRIYLGYYDRHPEEIERPINLKNYFLKQRYREVLRK